MVDRPGRQLLRHQPQGVISGADIILGSLDANHRVACRAGTRHIRHGQGFACRQEAEPVPEAGRGVHVIVRIEIGARVQIDLPDIFLGIMIGIAVKHGDQGRPGPVIVELQPSFRKALAVDQQISAFLHGKGGVLDEGVPGSRSFDHLAGRHLLPDLQQEIPPGVEALHPDLPHVVIGLQQRQMAVIMRGSVRGAVLRAVSRHKAQIERRGRPAGASHIADLFDPVAIDAGLQIHAGESVVGALNAFRGKDHVLRRVGGEQAQSDEAAGKQRQDHAAVLRHCELIGPGDPDPVVPQVLIGGYARARMDQAGQLLLVLHDGIPCLHNGFFVEISPLSPVGITVIRQRGPGQDHRQAQQQQNSRMQHFTNTFHFRDLLPFVWFATSV